MKRAWEFLGAWWMQGADAGTPVAGSVPVWRSDGTATWSDAAGGAEILVDDATGEILIDDATGNVLYDG
jgi:hypothetical protein